MAFTNNDRLCRPCADWLLLNRIIERVVEVQGSRTRHCSRCARTGPQVTNSVFGEIKLTVPPTVSPNSSVRPRTLATEGLPTMGYLRR